MPRTLVIGDIHGCGAALRGLLADVQPQSDDTLIALGDYVDRGLETRDVLDRMIALSAECQLISLRGNHEAMMLAARESDTDQKFWLQCGGRETLASYGPAAALDNVPETHWQFIGDTRQYHETDTHIFVHANYVPALSMDRQDPNVLLWLSARDYIPGPHYSGKTVIVGHTPQPEVLDLGHLIILDTGCYRAGLLTAMDVNTKRLFQVDSTGRPRRTSEPTESSK